MKTGGQLFIENNPVRTPDGARRLLTTTRVAIPDADGDPQYLLAVLEDVTERRRAEERIAHLAHHDPLTDLPNRAAFTEHLAETLRVSATPRRRDFAVLCIDLDRFKEVNDVFGHSVGDALLRDCPDACKSRRRAPCSRGLGGDEFAVISTSGPQPRQRKRSPTVCSRRWRQSSRSKDIACASG